MFWKTFLCPLPQFGLYNSLSAAPFSLQSCTNCHKFRILRFWVCFNLLIALLCYSWCKSSRHLFQEGLGSLAAWLILSASPLPRHSLFLLLPTFFFQEQETHVCGEARMWRWKDEMGTRSSMKDKGAAYKSVVQVREDIGVLRGYLGW